MPLMKLCSYPQCTKLAEKGQRYCSEHSYLEEKKKPDFSSFTRHNDFYNTQRWKTVSKRFLSTHPQCALCGGVATEVHHNYEGDEDYSDEDRFFDEVMFIPLCHSCHQKMTQIQLQKRQRQIIERAKVNRELKKRGENKLWY